jgi:hypothetical protein
MFLGTSSAFPNAERLATPSQEILVIVFWVSFFCDLYVGSSSSAAAAADNQVISSLPLFFESRRFHGSSSELLEGVMDDHQEEMPMADGNAHIHMWTELQGGNVQWKSGKSVVT